MLWAFTPQGMVLNNFANGNFVELDAFDREAWALLDGSHSVGQVAALIANSFGLEEAEATVRVTGLVGRLVHAGFLVERSRD